MNKKKHMSYFGIGPIYVILVRNPIYSAFAIVFTGILCLYNNLLLLIFPFTYWLLLSIIVKKEEIILEKIFGKEYLIYKSKVNRCIPWFPK
ncbi:methyltransferase family protein [Vallitalea guaymasensis]|uniref:methyltransferase family protein n=1 Tax=Vallitalea guaymasensis TaxID=1185412 RepID=UPI000DE25E63|nr:methyltransferase [Vallitalea guaymasensis]